MCGATLEAIALDIGHDRRLVARVVFAHGTETERRTGYVRRAAPAGTGLALALLVALLLPALARAGWPGPQLSTRAVRRELADRAWHRDPLAQLAGWRYTRVRCFLPVEERYELGRLERHNDGTTVEAIPGRWRSEGAQLVTTEGILFDSWLLVGPDGTGRIEWRRREGR